MTNASVRHIERCTSMCKLRFINRITHNSLYLYFALSDSSCDVYVDKTVGGQCHYRKITIYSKQNDHHESVFFFALNMFNLPTRIRPIPNNNFRRTVNLSETVATRLSFYEMLLSIAVKLFP